MLCKYSFDSRSSSRSKVTPLIHIFPSTTLKTGFLLLLLILHPYREPSYTTRKLLCLHRLCVLFSLFSCVESYMYHVGVGSKMFRRYDRKGTSLPFIWREEIQVKWCCCCVSSIVFMYFSHSFSLGNSCSTCIANVLVNITSAIHVVVIIRCRYSSLFELFQIGYIPILCHGYHRPRYLDP